MLTTILYAVAIMVGWLIVALLVAVFVGLAIRTMDGEPWER